MIKPCGFYVLVRVDEVKNEVEEGAIKGFVLSTKGELKREETGHDIGKVVAFGPTVFSGFSGISEVISKDGNPEEWRALEWGVMIGDKVEFTRYDGKIPRTEGYENHRLIQDSQIICKVED